MYRLLSMRLRGEIEINSLTYQAFVFRQENRNTCVDLSYRQRNEHRGVLYVSGKLEMSKMYAVDSN